MTPEVTLRLSANAAGLTAALQGVQQRLGATSAAADAAGRSAARGLGQVEASGRRASDALTELVTNAKAFAASFVGLAGVGALARIADEYTNLSSKIRLVTKSEQELRSVRQAVFEVAQQTRQDLTATAELYTRLARSTADMGLSQQQLLGITTTINQAFVVSGASAAEASAAITQLSQGFASGVLRGEEFNSVAEQAPLIMDLLAKELSVTRGELRKMAEDGKLTADVLVSALGNGAAGVAEQFGKMQLTIGQATTQLQNAFTAFIGQADEANGASRAFAQSISWLAENLPTVANAVFRFGLAIAALYSAPMLARAAAFTVQLGLQTAAHIASTAALIRQQGVMATLFATQAAGFAASIKSIGALNVALSGLAAGFAGWQIGTWLREEFLEVELFGIAMVEGLLVAWERMKAGAVIAWEGIKAAAVGYFNIARENLASLIEAMANVAQSAAQSGGKVAEFFGVSEGTAEGMRKLAASIRPTTSAWEGFQAAAAAAAAEADKNIAAIRQTTGDMADYAIQSRQAQDATGGLAAAAADATNRMPALASGVDEVSDALKKIKDASKEAREGLAGLLDRQAAELGGPAVRAAQAYRDTLVDLLDKEEAMRKAGELSADVQAMLAKARADAAQIYAKDLAAASAKEDEFVNRSREHVSEYQQIWERGLDNVAFAFGDFISGSIRSFSDLGSDLVRTARRMLADIVGTFLRQRIIIPIQMAMSGGAGGLAGAAGQLAGAGGGGLGSILGSLSPGALFGNAAFGMGTSLFGLGGSIGAFGGGMATAGANMLGSGFFGSMGANLSGAFASFGGGSLAAGLGQLLPVVGQIAAIAGIVNSLAGGRLFGTSFKPDSSARQIEIGAGGAGGFESRVDVRQRSLFRGRQWRETRSDLGSDVMEQITQLFDAVQAGMQTAARATGARVPAMIAGSFRQEFDKDGKLQREFSTIAGRVYNESQEAFGQRLLAENLLAVLADVLPQAEIQRVAESWRANAAELLDGAQLLTAVATELRAARPLFDNADGMTERLVALTVSLQEAGETLTETFTRVVGATRAYGSAVASIEQERLLAGLSGFQRGLIEIRQQERGRLQQLQDLARAAGNLQAREQDLAAVRQASVEAQQRLAESLRLELADLAAELYGTPLSIIEDQLAQLTEVQRAADDAARSVRDFLQSLRQSDQLSPLTDAQRRAEALEGLRRASAAGDAEAFREQADALLQVSRRLFASGRDYSADFDLVQQLGGRFQGGANAGQIAALEAERDALLERDRRAQRLATAQTLAQGLADYARASGQSFANVAGGLGFNLEQLAGDLGIGRQGLDAYLSSLQNDTDALIATLEALPDRIARAMFDLLIDDDAPGAPGPGPGTGPGIIVTPGGPGIGPGIGPVIPVDPIGPVIPREAQIQGAETLAMLRSIDERLSQIKRASETTADGVQATAKIQQRALDKAAAGKAAPALTYGAR